MEVVIQEVTEPTTAPHEKVTTPITADEKRTLESDSSSDSSWTDEETTKIEEVSPSDSPAPEATSDSAESEASSPVDAAAVKTAVENVISSLQANAA